jgi:hypothetical protein
VAEALYYKYEAHEYLILLAELGPGVYRNEYQKQKNNVSGG